MPNMELNYVRQEVSSEVGDNVVIVRYQGHEIVYSLIDPNDDVTAFEDKVPAWAKAMGILHALRYILEVPELGSILSTCCARMRELYRLRAQRVSLSHTPEGDNRG